MPLSPAFTISQSALTPAYITATDASTGSDAAIAIRRIYFETNLGTNLVESGNDEDYETWSYADSSDTWDILDTDQALSVTVEWLNSSNVVLYELTQVFCLSQFNKNFFIYLIQNQGLTPGVLQNANYFSSISTYWMNIIGAIKAIEIGADISGSQNCLDRATEMMQKQNVYFN
jgi:hypothetical protein